MIIVACVMFFFLQRLRTSFMDTPDVFIQSPKVYTKGKYESQQYVHLDGSGGLLCVGGFHVTLLLELLGSFAFVLLSAFG